MAGIETDCDSPDLVYLDYCCTADRQRDNHTDINMVHSEKSYDTRGGEHTPPMPGAEAGCASWRQVRKYEIQHGDQDSEYETMFRVPSKMGSPGNKEHSRYLCSDAAVVTG